MHWNLLLVDDEAGIIQAIRRMLRGQPYTIYDANNAEQALELIHQHTIHLMVTDYKMPGTDGLNLCRQVRQLAPACYRILLSGQVDYDALHLAWQHGDVHRFVAKPWDNLLLANDIREGLKQHVLLDKAHSLRQGIEYEQPILLTDENWIIRLANRPLCQQLNLSEEQLLGRNLFAQSLSAMPVTLEAEVTRQVEASHSWLGFFNFHQDEQSKCPSWMAVSPLGEQYRVCICRFVSEATPAPNTISDELKRYSGEHHLQRLEQDASHAGNSPRLLVIDFSEQQVNDKDLSSMCYERLHEATDEQFEIYAPQLNVFLVLLPSNLDFLQCQKQQMLVERAMQNPLHFHDQPLQLTPKITIEQRPDYQPDWNQWLRQRLGIVDIQQDAALETLPETSTDNDNNSPSCSLSALPVFSQQGELVALQVPLHSMRAACQQQDPSWLHWIESMHNAWQQDFSQPLTLLLDAQSVNQSVCNDFINALQSYNQQLDQPNNASGKPLQCVVIADEELVLSQSGDDLKWRNQLLQQGCQLFLNNFGRSFVNSRQVLSLPIQGIVLAPEFLSNMKSSKALLQSRRLLQRIRDKNMLIYSPQTDDTEALASAHQSNVDWLSGGLLSPPVNTQQLRWFACQQLES